MIKLAQKCKFTSNFMDLKALQKAWTLPWRSTWRCRAVMGLIRWSTGCRTAWVVRHCWLLVCLAHLRSAILQRNIDQGHFTLRPVSWATLLFSNQNSSMCSCVLCRLMDREWCAAPTIWPCVSVYFWLHIWFDTQFFKPNVVLPPETTHTDACLEQMAHVSCFPLWNRVDKRSCMAIVPTA